MKKSERIAELERRVRELEARQPIITIYPQYTQPYYIPQPYWTSPTYYPVRWQPTSAASFYTETGSASAGNLTLQS